MRLGEVNTTTTTSVGSQITDIVGSLAKAVPLYQQNKIFEAQLQLEKQRAAKGDGKINVDNLQPPGIPVKFSISPEIMMLGAAAILGLFFVMKKR